MIMEDIGIEKGLILSFWGDIMNECGGAFIKKYKNRQKNTKNVLTIYNLCVIISKYLRDKLKHIKYSLN